MSTHDLIRLRIVVTHTCWHMGSPSHGASGVGGFYADEPFMTNADLHKSGRCLYTRARCPADMQTPSFSP